MQPSIKLKNGTEIFCLDNKEHLLLHHPIDQAFHNRISHYHVISITDLSSPGAPLHHYSCLLPMWCTVIDSMDSDANLNITP